MERLTRLRRTTLPITRMKRHSSSTRRRLGLRDWKTAVGLAFDLVNQGVIDLERLVRLCSTNPARIFGLKDRGTLMENAHADVTILDPACEWVFDVATSKSKSRNTPFHGRAMTGAAVATIVGGRFGLPQSGLHSNNSAEAGPCCGKVKSNHSSQRSNRVVVLFMSSIG